MTAIEIYEKSAEKIKELVGARSCLVCNFFRTSECPRIRCHAKNGYGWKIVRCPKWEYYLGGAAL